VYPGEETQCTLDGEDPPISGLCDGTGYCDVSSGELKALTPCTAILPLSILVTAYTGAATRLCLPSVRLMGPIKKCLGVQMPTTTESLWQSICMHQFFSYTCGFFMHVCP
jgi:hypothetical protein